MRLRHVWFFAVALALCGCAGYRLGPTGGQVAGEKSIQVAPFVNNTPEPGLANELTGALRKSFQRDGTFRLATHGDGDLVVSGVIGGYQRRELSLLREDLRTVRDYQINLTAQVTVRERSSGRVLIERSVVSQSLVRVSDDFGGTERQAAPLLAGDLARQIVSLVAEGSW
jgi:hypothetical protein